MLGKTSKMFVLALFLNDVDAVRTTLKSKDYDLAQRSTTKIDLNQPIQFVSKDELDADRKEQVEYQESLQERQEGINKKKAADEHFKQVQAEMKDAESEVNDADNRIRHVRKYYAEKDQIRKEKMEEFFKKSNIYKRFVQETHEETADAAEFNRVDSNLHMMKKQMLNLHQKYDQLNHTIRLQERDAKTLQSLINVANEPAATGNSSNASAFAARRNESNATAAASGLVARKNESNATAAAA